MSTYVINNRIPRFPILNHYPDKGLLEKELEEAFQIWLKERLISNLIRRKACSQVYDHTVWMESRSLFLEHSQAGDFAAWCSKEGFKPKADWGDFLRYARRKVKGL